MQVIEIYHNNRSNSNNNALSCSVLCTLFWVPFSFVLMGTKAYFFPGRLNITYSPAVKIVWGRTSTSWRLSTQTALPSSVLFCYALYVLHWISKSWNFHSFAGCGNYSHNLLFNILNPTGYLMQQQLWLSKIYTFCPHCIYLRTNSFCSIWHKLISFCNCVEMRFLCGMNWIFKIK
jgi:hypothetical protein